jgi:hypothetical protein
MNRVDPKSTNLYFRLKSHFQSAPSPIYDDRQVTLRYYTRDLV